VLGSGFSSTSPALRRRNQRCKAGNAGPIINNDVRLPWRPKVGWAKFAGHCSVTSRAIPQEGLCMLSHRYWCRCHTSERFSCVRQAPIGRIETSGRTYSVKYQPLTVRNAWQYYRLIPAGTSYYGNWVPSSLARFLINSSKVWEHLMLHLQWQGSATLPKHWWFFMSSFNICRKWVTKHNCMHIPQCRQTRGGRNTCRFTQ